MAETKTVAERLREKHANLKERDCWAFPEAVGKKCRDFKDCQTCVEYVLNALADMIEAEQSELDECIEVLESDRDDYIEHVTTFACWQMQIANMLDIPLAERNNSEEVQAKIITALKERTKTEHDGVDVNALLKLADEFERIHDLMMRDYDSRLVGYDAITNHPNKAAEIIRNAVKGSNPSKSTGLPKGFNMPLDADGEPCFLDDAVWHKRRKHLVVAVSHKGKVCIRDWETRDSGKGAVWVKAERVSHKEPETKEATFEDLFDGKCAKVGTYGCYAPMLTYPDSKLISVDKCLVPEIAQLQLSGIKTIGCCCGHPKDRERGNKGFIQVDPESVDAMLALGYEQQPSIPVDENPDHDMGLWCFTPKTKLMGGE